MKARDITDGGLCGTEYLATPDEIRECWTLRCGWTRPQPGARFVLVLRVRQGLEDTQGLIVCFF